MKAIRQGFSRLTDFRGRDRRGQFWPYAGVVVALVYVGLALVMVPVLAGLITETTTYATAHPDQVTVVAGPGHYSVEIHDPNAMSMPDFRVFFLVMTVAVVLLVSLLAAAVTRRLHDMGRAGWWGLPPVVFLATALVLFPRMMDQMMQAEVEAPSLALFILLFTNNMIHVLYSLVLIVMLGMESTRGPNRYGPEPD